ncbi:uncharacterized protein B0H18DRAFT_1124204 [Fomitopsis serialis]|uniref:uncharacterized protein n=1 Tax=Fomitopsis serialis TaxID=139415 RepID=UPI002008BCB4|nr:uncharacterized protein B0H18DRAFT_1124204 [Neoantrodia serialis]KAH9916474.1 hypothetical protein B0H18DRAFT_1124204 [Neoantrodia serialis]
MFEILADAAAMTGEQKCKGVLLYCSKKSDFRTRSSARKLREYVEEYRKQRKIRDLEDFRKYMLGFVVRAGDLVEQNRMTEAEHDLLFYQGLTTAIRQAIKPDSVDNVDYFSDSDDDSESDSGGGDRAQTDVLLKAMTNFTDFLEKVTLLLPQGTTSAPQQTTAGSAMSATTRVEQLGQYARSCYMCGKEEGKDLDHRLGMGYCHHTTKWLADGTLVYSPQGRLTFADGTELPNGRSNPGGIAAILQQQIEQHNSRLAGERVA